MASTVPVYASGGLGRPLCGPAGGLRGAEAAQRLLGHASGEKIEHYLALEMQDAMGAGQQLVASGWRISSD